MLGVWNHRMGVAMNRCNWIPAFAGLALAALAGCATDPAAIASLAEAQARMSQVRTLEGECGGPCKFAYTDPRDRPSIALPTNGWDVGKAMVQEVGATARGAVPYLTVGTVAVEGLKHAGKNTTTTNTASGSGASAGGGEASHHTEQIGPDSQNTNTTTTTDNSNQGNATATPTVVVQPAPLVVFSDP